MMIASTILVDKSQNAEQSIGLRMGIWIVVDEVYMELSW